MQLPVLDSVVKLLHLGYPVPSPSLSLFPAYSRIVSDVAVGLFMLKRDVKLQPTNRLLPYLFPSIVKRPSETVLAC